MKLIAIILAAGEGKRMRSALPKVLHPLAGRPMLSHILEAAEALKPVEVRVVHGHRGEQVQAAFPGRAIGWFHQARQRGTGHAVRQAWTGVPADSLALVLYGDVPLVRPATLRRLVHRAARGRLALLTVELPDPAGYGRILRAEDGSITGIVEDRDATAAQRAIREVNTGVLACPSAQLGGWLRRLRPHNVQKEYYLTDVVRLAVRDAIPVEAVRAADPGEVAGINDKAQLAQAERLIQGRTAAALMTAGVTVADPARLDVRGRLRCGRDVHIDVGVVFDGDVRLGDGVRVGPYSVIRDTTVGAGTVIHSHCVLEQGVIGERCEIGPYARMRPGVELAEGAKLGNFVEVKKSLIGEGSKVNHLSYIGDTTIGTKVNVGAGTITCNYDGARKHRTVIGDRAFIGSGVELVAPVEIGADATIGAGSTITRQAPAGQLTLERSKQVTVPHWKRPVKPSGS